MATSTTYSKQQAHELIERMSAAQVSAVVGLLETMLDPVSMALANAPIDDEPISDEEARAVAVSKAWLKDHDPIPNEEVLAEFGLTAEDFERMGRTPLEPESHPGQQAWVRKSPGPTRPKLICAQLIRQRRSASCTQLLVISTQGIER